MILDISEFETLFVDWSLPLSWRLHDRHVWWWV